MSDLAGTEAPAFRALFHNEHAVMLLIDPASGAIVDANPAAEHFYGHARAALRGMRVFDLSTEPEANVRGEMAATRARRRVRFTLRHRLADGSERDVRIASGPINLGGRDLLYWVVDDVSELMNARDHLRIRDQALDALDTALVLTDREGRIAWRNPAFTRLTGYEIEEAIGLRPGDLLASGEQDEAFYRNLWETIEAGHTWRGTLVNRRKDGSRYDEEMTITPILDEAGRPTHFIAAKQDVTERRQYERALERWQTLFRITHAGLALTDTNGTHFALVNDAFARMHGYEPEELMGHPVTDVFEPEDAPEDFPRVDDALERVERTGHVTFEAHHRRRDGTPFPVTVDITRLDPATELNARFLATVQDVSELRELAQRVESLTYVDQLTGLPNRQAFEHRLARQLEAAYAEGRQLLICYISLDGFRGVNATFGYEAGDAVLLHLANMLAAETEGSGTWARLGGDTFAWLQTGRFDEAAATAVAQRWQAVCARPIPIGGDGDEVRLSASVAIALAPDDGSTPTELTSRAEAALQAAKAGGAEAVRFFAPALNEVARERLQLRSALNQALSEQEITVALQPQVVLDGGELVGVEALARWTHATWGPVSPARFVEEAERSGLIRRLGRGVLRQAAEHAATNSGWSWRVPRVAVNVSVRELADPKLADEILEDLAASGLSPDRLEVEVTESAVMTAEATALDVLSQLRAHGVRVAIDDFGKGHASLAYLRLLPADTLKIDAQFVRGLGTDATRADEALVRSIVQLAEAFELEVIAEGIETEEERAFLQGIGCRVGQGYLFAAPMRPYELTAWLDAR